MENESEKAVLEPHEVKNMLAFLDRVQLQGNEAETLVRLRYKLIQINDEMAAKDAAA